MIFFTIVGIITIIVIAINFTSLKKASVTVEKAKSAYIDAIDAYNK
jgi:hypothetical protein